jgi:preprotein translocase subunit Sec63
MSEPHIQYFDMGPWPVYLGFTKSKKAFAKEMKRLDVSGVEFLATDHSSATTHMLRAGGVQTYIIAMGSTKGRSIQQIASLIAHEAAHVAQDMWEQLGEKSPGKEAEAYLIQHIVQCILQVALKTRRKRKVAP